MIKFRHILLPPALLALIASAPGCEKPDTESPVITLSGSAVVVLAHGTPYSEPGFTATDPEEGDITSKVVVTGTVDANTAKTYTLKYIVSDAAGHGTSAERKVIVRHTKNSLSGNFTAADNCTPGGSSGNYNCSVSPIAGGNEFTINLNNLGNYAVSSTVHANLTGENSLSLIILQQTVNGITFSGNGTVNPAGNKITINYTAVDTNSVSSTCTSVWNK